ncbi:MAG: pentapeptide repeat-containing protein, partial [Anaerolineales bacterium]|nr:pentapeptide repeat-containing protein [Anaerolineales bacterium]
GADLSWAILTGANLTGADLTGTNLAWANLQESFFDNETKWPDDYDPILAGAMNLDE